MFFTVVLFPYGRMHRLHQLFCPDMLYCSVARQFPSLICIFLWHIVHHITTSQEEEEPRMKAKKGKAGKGGKNDSKLTFSQEGGFAATGGAPGEKAECKQN